MQKKAVAREKTYSMIQQIYVYIYTSNVVCACVYECVCVAILITVDASLTCGRIGRVGLAVQEEGLVNTERSLLFNAEYK